MTSNTINGAVTTLGNAEGALLAGRYRVVRQLGQGGMGSVWLVEDTQLDNKLFAIKMLPSILVANKRAYRQLKDEALVAMKLAHTNIVTLRAFEENSGNPFLVMDYIDGQTLDDYLAERGKLSEEEVIGVLRPIAAALDYAHSKGVVHRDVKPGNVMIAKDGTPYILDFGIAREIQETMTRVTGKLSSGTLLYMSPEQLRGQAPKAAHDVYSFAAMAYECLKGEPPFSRGQVEYQILNEQPPPLPAGVMLAASVMRGLSKEQENRPDSCGKVLSAVPPMKQTQSTRMQISAQPRRTVSLASDRTVVPQKRHTTGIVIAVVCILAAIAVLGGVMWYRNAQRQESIREQAIAAQHAEAARRLQEEEQRRAQEAVRKKEEEVRRAQEAVRKKAVEERLARQKAENERNAEARRIEEEKKVKAIASEIRAEAKIQKGKVDLISAENVLRRKIDLVTNLFAKAEESYNKKRWNEAAVAFTNHVLECRSLLALDEERQAAVQSRNKAQVAFKAAESDGAKTYDRDNWNAAVKVWQKAAGEFGRMDFAAASESFEDAAKRFAESGRGAREEKRRREQEAAQLRIAEQKRMERQAEERKRKYERYSAVKVGSLVQIASNKMAEGEQGALGVVASNENGYIVLENGFTCSYAEIANVIIRANADENAMMRKNLVGAWVGETKYVAGGVAINMKYEYSFNADGSAQQKVTTSWQGSNRTSTDSGTWSLSDNGQVLSYRVTSGAEANNTFVYKLKKLSNDSIEFQHDLDNLKRSRSSANMSNERYWYDAYGIYHYEGDSRSGGSTYHIVNTETPKIMKRMR